MAEILSGRLEATELKKSIRSLGRVIYKGMRSILRAIGRDFKTDFTAARLSGRPGLARTRKGSPVMHTVKGSRIDNLLLRIGFRPRVRRFIVVHEAGGSIAAKKAYANIPGGPYLRVPLLGKNGRPMRQGKNANTFIGKSRSGKYFVFQRTEAGKIRPLYVLKKEIKIPPRLEFFPSWVKVLPRVIARLQGALSGLTHRAVEKQET